MQHETDEGYIHPFVSVIIPCYNEEKYIRSFLENILHQDYPGDQLEVFIIDGLSTDRTEEIIEEYHRRYPYIQMLLNEKRFVPFALNLGVVKSHGDIVMRMDAHSEYPLNYISTLVRYLLTLEADNVGGFYQIMPGDDSIQALAISGVLSSPFGTGNAKYRTRVKEICRVDTVPYGCYQRGIFDKIGFFDEDLLRNQDYEFNARLIKNGGSIFLIPSVTVKYFSRSSIKQLFSMHYQYGLYNPLVALKVGRPMLSRHLVPMVFLLFVIITGAGSFLFPLSFWFLIGVLIIYLAGDFFFTMKIIQQTQRAKLALYLPWIFFFLHISYGWGSLTGIFRFFVFRKNKRIIPSTR